MKVKEAGLFVAGLVIGAVIGGVIVAGGDWKTQAVKELIVKDGSVEVYAEGSTLAPKNNGKHGWSRKADVFEIMSGADKDDACSKPLPNARFEMSDVERVTFKVNSEQNPSLPVTQVTAANEGSVSNGLSLNMADGWEFAWKDFRRVLSGTGTTASLRLDSIVVRRNQQDASFVAPAGEFLCGKFRNR